MNKKEVFLIVLIILVVGVIGYFIVNDLFFGENDSYDVESMNWVINEEIEELFDCKEPNWTRCAEMNMHCTNTCTPDMAIRVRVYLKDKTAEIKRGNYYGVGFGIKNIHNRSLDFDYLTAVIGDSNCGDLNNNVINEWIISGDGDSINIPSEEIYVGIIRFKIPEEVHDPCFARLWMNVSYIEEEEIFYSSEVFDIHVI
jgi:hypothetical protein